MGGIDEQSMEGWWLKSLAQNQRSCTQARWLLHEMWKV
jgi:hypothetical protein